MPLSDAKSWAFRVIRGDISKYDMSPDCRGCKGTGRGRKRCIDHPNDCMNRVMEKIMEDGDPDKRAENATRIEIEKTVIQGKLEALVAQREIMKRSGR